ncbi:hypothetical protein D3C85_1470560 [compost metagenome]
MPDFPLLLDQYLNTGQHIVHNHLGDRLHALGATSLKINSANLIAQHHTLRLSTGTAQRYGKSCVAGKVAALSDWRNQDQP